MGGWVGACVRVCVIIYDCCYSLLKGFHGPLLLSKAKGYSYQSLSIRTFPLHMC